MPSKFPSPEDIQAVPFEISSKQRKLLVVSIYRSPDQKLDYSLFSITVALDHYLQHYKDFIILDDFNESAHNPKMQSFLSQQGCKNIMKNKTCLKSMEGSCTYKTGKTLWKHKTSCQ